jgi:hypothetical protein
MSGIFYKGLFLFVSLALCASVTTWIRARQELRVVRDANESLRSTLGELTIAIAGKDREIDRLARFPCGSGDKAPAAAGKSATRGPVSIR